MSYQRVIPRDLFNEASLLKCYGRLYILTEDNPDAHFPEEFGGSFDVTQRWGDGDLFIENLPFRVGGHWYRLARPLNARSAWPLYAERIDDPDWEAVSVFDADGNLSAEMTELIAAARLDAAAAEDDKS